MLVQEEVELLPANSITDVCHPSASVWPLCTNCHQRHLALSSRNCFIGSRERGCENFLCSRRRLDFARSDMSSILSKV